MTDAGGRSKVTMEIAVRGGSGAGIKYQPALPSCRVIHNLSIHRIRMIGFLSLYLIKNKIFSVEYRKCVSHAHMVYWYSMLQCVSVV